MVILGTKCEAFPQMLTYQEIQFASIHQYVKYEASDTSVEAAPGSSSSAPHFAELLLEAEWMDTWIAKHKTLNLKLCTVALFKKYLHDHVIYVDK